MNPLTPEKILRNLTNGYYMSHQEQEEAAAYIRQLQESNEVLKAGMIEFADTIFKLKRELADLIEQPFQLTDAGVDTNIPLWGLEPKGSGMVTLNHPEQEHKPWCDYLNVTLTSMPPQRAKCNCKIAQPEQANILQVADAVELNVATKVDRLFVANELRRLHDENETLKKCLLQMQNAAIELAKPEQEECVCCGDYERCLKPCTPRNRWQGEQNAFAQPERKLTEEGEAWGEMAKKMSRDFVENAKKNWEPPPKGVGTITIGELRKTDLYRRMATQSLREAFAPPREWVGLTEDERNEMIGRIQHDQFTRQRDLIGKTQIITEMYLKGRNT